MLWTIIQIMRRKVNNVKTRGMEGQMVGGSEVKTRGTEGRMHRWTEGKAEGQRGGLGVVDAGLQPAVEASLRAEIPAMKRIFMSESSGDNFGFKYW